MSETPSPDTRRVLPMSLELFERECERLIRSIPLDDPFADLDTRNFAINALLCVREFIDYRAKQQQRKLVTETPHE